MEYIDRSTILSRAVEDCMKAMYKIAQPKVEWDDFVQQNKDYKEGPRPYEFYYLPEKVFQEIVKMYHHAYRIPPELKDNVKTLIEYFNEPIRTKYTKEDGRGIEHFTPLKEVIGEDNFNKVVEYLNEAATFYRWDGDLNSFNMSIYFGATPNSNKEAVIENWKKYKGINITIDESIYDDD